MEKHSVSRLSYLFAHLHLLSSDSFSSDLLSSNLPLLSASALLCFSSVHIVGSLTSKLPSINVMSYYIIFYPIISYYIIYTSFTPPIHRIYMSYTSHIHLIYNSFTSHMHLIYISYTSQKHFVCIPKTSHTHLIYISSTSHLHLIYISCTSRLHLKDISYTSHKHLICISFTSYIHLIYISYVHILFVVYTYVNIMCLPAPCSIVLSCEVFWHFPSLTPGALPWQPPSL